MRRLLFIGIYLFFCWAIVVLGIKSYWKFCAGVPLSKTPLTVDFFYGEVRQSKVQELHPRHEDDYFDVLLLGGSVLTPDWGSVERCLTEKLKDTAGERFRVFNLARQSHTSRDSLIKYWLVAGEEFDLVLVYDGINDVAMNCCPRDEFRDDYLHFSWYREVAEAIETGKMSLPISLSAQAPLVGQGLFRANISPEMMEFGREIKTVQTLRRNHEEILGAAATRGDRVLLVTFAYDIPLNPPDKQPAESGLEHSRSNRLTCWGKLDYVAAALDAQNAAIRELADAHPEVLFIDERALMPEGERLFIDPCHLSEEGSRRFAENLWPAVAMRLAEWRTQQRTPSSPASRR
jgi:lysophospholipase L1-like esterase